MLNKILSKINKEKYILNKAIRILLLINNLEKDVIKLTRDQMLNELKNIKKTLNLKPYCTESKDYIDTVPMVFSIVREASRRMLNERHFDTQIKAALCLNECTIIEMRTGQGKTLTATLSSIYRSLWGTSVHILTANDYLAQRDYEWMKPIYDYLNIETDYIVKNKSEKQKTLSYAKNVVYVSNHEIGFDYLRSNMKYDKDQILIEDNSLNHAIVDEADSILIDNARIPIIIGSSIYTNTDFYWKASKKVIYELSDEDVELNEKEKDVKIKETSLLTLESLIEKYFKINSKDIYKPQNINILYYIDRSLRAKYIFKKNFEYIVDNHKVYIIDEYTGRVADDRKFSGGIQQAIEAKENLNITPESIQVNYITTQNIYRKYKHMSGMTGTAHTEKKEFEVVYNTTVVRIAKEEADNLICHKDLFFKSKDGKYAAIAQQVQKCYMINQPILIGTSSIQDSEEISVELDKLKIPYSLLNAKKLIKEAEIIANAGMPGAVTIATNVAGRGTDIKLGGSAELQIKKEIEIKNISDAEEISTISQRIRSEVALNAKIAEEAGGLYVIISQKQENRRIDNQFKGRTGRRDNRGEVRTFISLNDDIFKYSKGNKVASLFIDNNKGTNSYILDKLILRLQKTIEQSMFEARVGILNQDHMLSKSRDMFFSIRQKVLKDEVDFKETFKEITKRMLSPNNRTIKHIRENFKLFLNKYIDRKIEERIDISIFKDQFQQFSNNIIDQEIIDKNYQQIKLNYLKELDSLWSEFINAKEIAKRLNSFKNKIDYILDYNRQLCNLFEAIFANYESVFLTSVYDEYMKNIEIK